MTYPDFPCIVEAELVGPDADHAPAIKQDDSNGDGVEHGFGSELEALLNCPKCVYANRLRESCQFVTEWLRNFKLTCAAIPTISRYVSSRVLYATMLFCKVAITVTVVFRESPSKK